MEEQLVSSGTEPPTLRIDSHLPAPCGEPSRLCSRSLPSWAPATGLWTGLPASQPASHLSPQDNARGSNPPTEPLNGSKLRRCMGHFVLPSLGLASYV